MFDIVGRLSLLVFGRSRPDLQLFEVANGANVNAEVFASYAQTLSSRLSLKLIEIGSAMVCAGQSILQKHAGPIN